MAFPQCVFAHVLIFHNDLEKLFDTQAKCMRMVVLQYVFACAMLNDQVAHIYIGNLGNHKQVIERLCVLR